MWEDKSEEAKSLFKRVMLDNASGEVWVIINNIINNPRTNIDIDWNAVYGDITRYFPQYVKGAKVSIADVDQAFDDYETLRRLVNEYNVDTYAGLTDDDLEAVLSEAFSYL